MTSIDRMYQLIQKPVITEKASDDTVKRNAYHFRVPAVATKVEIRQSIEKLFEVRVTGVNTLNVSPKFRRRGYAAGHTPRWKKAMVTLSEGQTIDLL